MKYLKRINLNESKYEANDELAEVPYLLCSAIWYKDLPTMRLLPKNCDKGIVLCGHRHGNIIAQMMATMKLRTVTFANDGVGEHIQGFLKMNCLVKMSGNI